MKSIAEMSRSQATRIRYVLMDIDDTVTRRGKLLALSYAALWKLKEADFKVIPVTGRPAGWCDCIAREWPVDAVIGENGALAFWEESAPRSAEEAAGVERLPVLKARYHPNAVKNDHPVLACIRRRALAETPGIRDAKDQFARLFDIALDFAEEEPALPLSAAEQVRGIAIEEGARAKVSSIHVNIWMGDYDKLSMTELFLRERFGWQGDLTEIMFVGDSPNDEPMFARFPLACAVANIRRYEGLIKSPPAFAASRECGDGFAEIVHALLEKSVD
ncbi:MAG: HAD-IIB family hydrolase [Treponema sp.]|jgi:HAD superfamily hydrolase (TIGR01484 family)|nr:HAD-IIB family hydrolase [Treponema sp.]